MWVNICCSFWLAEFAGTPSGVCRTVPYSTRHAGAAPSEPQTRSPHGSVLRHVGKAVGAPFGHQRKPNRQRKRLRRPGRERPRPCQRFPGSALGRTTQRAAPGEPRACFALCRTDTFWAQALASPVRSVWSGAAARAMRRPLSGPPYTATQEAVTRRHK
jgi:hypothetical protein